MWKQHDTNYRYWGQRLKKFNPKDGIDNPGMVITDDTDCGPSACPRLCVFKRKQGESYGFSIEVGNEGSGHIIGSVGGIAEPSGLRNGDRLLEVNCYFVDDLSYQEVSKRIKISGDQLSLLVLSGEEYEQAKSKGHSLRSLATVNKDEDCKPPRLCHITKDPVSGLGISFTPVEGQKGHFAVSVVAGGAAEKAGVCKDDRLIWMNGATVADLTHSAIKKMLKNCGTQITILVVDAESEKYYNSQKIPILPAMAIPHNLPYMARKVHMVQNKNCYGFLLRLEMSVSGRIAHVLREMDSGGPAEKAGMKDGDLLLEVNGEAVESLKHEEIVDRIKQSNQEVTVTTITSTGLDFYTKFGLSPLLFCEETVVEKEQNCSVPAAMIDGNKSSFCKLRQCTLQKSSLGFGFNLSCIPQSPGTFISQVVDGGPGQKAGLLKGDVLMDVNGYGVEKKTLEDVIMLIKEGGLSVTLRVVQKSDHYQSTTEICSVEEEEISFF